MLRSYGNQNGISRSGYGFAPLRYGRRVSTVGSRPALADVAVPRQPVRMNDVDVNLLRRIPLSDIQQVTFYKRDELTTDLICCDVELAGRFGPSMRN